MTDKVYNSGESSRKKLFFVHEEQHTTASLRLLCSINPIARHENKVWSHFILIPDHVSNQESILLVKGRLQRKTILLSLSFCLEVPYNQILRWEQKTIRTISEFSIFE